MHHRLCDLLIGFFAIWTFCCHLCLVLGGNLYLAMSLTLIISLAIAAATFRGWRGSSAKGLYRGDFPFGDENKVQKRVFWFIALLAVVTASSVSRPDIDDSFHLNTALNAMLHPGAVISSKIDLILMKENQYWLPQIWRTQTADLFNGALALVTGLSHITVAHVVIPPIAAFIVIVAFWRLFYILTPKNAIWCLISCFVFLIAEGNLNVTFANFGGLVRLHHGKGLYLTGFVPLLAAETLVYLRSPSTASFFRLAIIQIAATGLTSTSLIISPVIVGLTLLGQFSFNLERIKHSILGVLSCFYPLLVGGICSIVFSKATGGMLNRADEYSSGFEYLMDVTSRTLAPDSFTVMVVCAFGFGWMFLADKRASRFVLLTPVLAIALFYNSYSFSFLALSNSIIPAKVYYRLLWIFQVPVMLSVLLAAPMFDDIRKGERWIVEILVPLVIGAIFLGKYSALEPTDLGTSGFLSFNYYLCAAIVFLVVWTSISLNLKSTRASKFLLVLLLFFFVVPVKHVISENNGVYNSKVVIDPLGLKVGDGYWAAARINQLAQPGSAIVAPEEVSAWVPTFKDHAFPLLARFEQSRSAVSVLDKDDLELRIELFKTAHGIIEDAEARRIISASIARYPLSVYCKVALSNSPSDHTLEELGFRLVDQVSVYQIWVRAQD